MEAAKTNRVKGIKETLQFNKADKSRQELQKN